MKRCIQKVKSLSLTFKDEETEVFWVYDKINRKKFILIIGYFWKLSHLILSSEEQQYIKDYGIF